MLKFFEDWAEENQNYWKQYDINVDEICRSNMYVEMIIIKHSTTHALGQIEIRAGCGADGNLYLLDFMAVKVVGEYSFNRHYEFTDTYDLDEWQEEYISFMCGL